MELVPLKATFAPGERVSIEVVGAAEGSVRVFRLDECVAAVDVAGSRLELDPLAPGGYGVELTGASGVVQTAFDVLADPLTRPRYGFVARFEAGRDVGAVVRNARRLHLNAMQFYDWMFRHARLVAESDEYTDPLGRRLSLSTVRSLADALRTAGCSPLGYAAVYAVGREAWGEWEDAVLRKADGTPWALGEEFLRIVDPTDRAWLEHFTGQLREASAACGFAGFHLDQYGDPKWAVRRDGVVVDLGRSFPVLIAHVRRTLPDARLIFNNVNNFPTSSTAQAPQDATYIEVWPPHTSFGHLARLIRDSRAVAPERPVILAAYLSVFAQASEEESLAAARLTMATIFSHGGAHLLAGEDGAVLTDPYYVNHHVAGSRTKGALRAWHDFAVRYGDLLYAPEAVDITTAVTGGVNEDVIVDADVPVSVDPVAGALWVRVVQVDDGLVVHLVDLSREADALWDAPKRPSRSIRGVRLRLRWARRPPTVHVASPELLPRLDPVGQVVDGEFAVVELPEFMSWAVAVVRFVDG